MTCCGSIIFYPFLVTKYICTILQMQMFCISGMTPTLKKAQGIKNSQRTKCKDIFQNVQGQPNFHSKLWGRIFVPGKYKLW